MLATVGTNEYDALIADPIGKSQIGGDMAMLSGNLMDFPAEAQDLSNFTFGDDAYDEEIVEVPQENPGKESTGTSKLLQRWWWRQSALVLHGGRRYFLFDLKGMELTCVLALFHSLSQLDFYNTFFFVTFIGRWTREEHLAFIKGLEMYGKGWKKIASLIKTRTVVQIRTHAQKYFLKLSKARQNGEHPLSKGVNRSGIDGARKRRPKKTDRPLALCPAVKQYFQKPLLGDSRGASPTINATSSAANEGKQNNVAMSNQNSSAGYRAGNQAAGKALGEGLLDAESGLFNFLSPVLNSDAGNTTASDTQSVNSGHSNSNSSLATVSPPLWYTKGAHLTNLLKDAEGLDWCSDKGIPHNDSVLSFTTSTSISTAASSPSDASKDGVDGPGATTTTNRNEFQPWNLVHQQQLYREEAATSVRGGGQGALASSIGGSALYPSLEGLPLPPSKRTKVEAGDPEVMQQPKGIADGPLAHSAFGSNNSGSSGVEGKPLPADLSESRMMEQMLSNQMAMQRQINELRNEARKAQHGASPRAAVGASAAQA